MRINTSFVGEAMVKSGEVYATKDPFKMYNEDKHRPRMICNP